MRVGIVSFMSDTAPHPTNSGLPTKVTDAMAHRGLRSEDAEHASIVHALGYGAMAEDVEYRMAQHRAKIAWAEVEYAARRAGNCVSTTYPAPPAAMMTARIAAAYAADDAVLAASRAKADALYRERYRMARR